MGRRSSISQGSSSGSDRSLSRSPVGRPRSLHRLPTAIQVSPVANKSSKNGASQRKTDESKNGKSRWHKRDRKVRDSRTNIDGDDECADDHPMASSSRLPSYLEQSTYSTGISMPPPSSIPPTQSYRGPHSPVGFRPTKNLIVEPRVDMPSSKQNRTPSVKGAGFKPIGKASSAVKRFFPGDEEEMDLGPLELHRASAEDVEASLPTSRKVPAINSWPNGKEPDSADAKEVFSDDRHENDRLPLYSDSHPNHTIGPVVLPMEPLLSSMAPPDILEKALSPNDGGEMSMDLQLSPAIQDSPNDTVAVSSPKDLYKIINQVGEGTFGKVYKARNTLTGGHVALKRIRMESERDGFPVTAIREIKLLQSLRHENVVRLFEMMVSNGEYIAIACVCSQLLSNRFSVYGV